MKAVFDEGLYKNKSINDLILFCIDSVSLKKEKCSFERLTKECFSLFPKVFCLKDFPQWPDTRKLDRPLRMLREKKLIKGGTQTSFSLTKQGKIIAQETSRSFGQGKLRI